MTYRTIYINKEILPSNFKSMIFFLQELKLRNEMLFYFGWICFIAALSFLLLTKVLSTKILGVNAWIKPFKFSASTTVYAWAMAWYCSCLPEFKASLFNWSVLVLLGFEIVYIAIQSVRGQLSHFNQTTTLYTLLYALMAIAATSITIYTAYIGILFCVYTFPNLPNYYLWSIRLGILIFVVFAFEGFVMGGRLTHTIGGEMNGDGIPVLNWSTKFGDPRVAHFIGMHALQVLPLLSYFVFKNIVLVFIFSFLYGALAVFTLRQALKGKPFYSFFR